MVVAIDEGGRHSHGREELLVESREDAIVE